MEPNYNCTELFPEPNFNLWRGAVVQSMGGRGSESEKGQGVGVGRMGDVTDDRCALFHFSNLITTTNRCFFVKLTVLWLIAADLDV